ncbi:MAG: ABC transporter ATP-binding protein [Actinobacteria bacterium]|nr:ABC transporter ATP-binding protein [Actinomycetota bacterium]MCB9390601.1 ABC transporter ATP-binding protein [Acidimicrobiia bacterium]
MAAAIEIRGVSKRFTLHHEKSASLKEQMLSIRRKTTSEFWALRDINLDVAKGETLGILGHNGSGKSTLLKCIGGILRPTKGEIRTAGRLAALLELGAGFHHELTGRENVYLNASILGLGKKEVDERFDEIVDFAELEPFIDNQVKNYSSGMFVRLGFAVAVMIEPQILLVDEVLSVGDEAFQAKCLDRVSQFQAEGRTIVLVTHSSDLVRRVCDRVAVLDHGNLIALGPPEDGIQVLREHLFRRRESTGSADPELDALIEATKDSDRVAERTLRARFTSVDMRHENSGSQRWMNTGGWLELHVRFACRYEIDDAVLTVQVHDGLGQVLFQATNEDVGPPLGALPSTGELVLRFPSVPLRDGRYFVSLGLHTADTSEIYDWREQQYEFNVHNQESRPGLVDMPIQVELQPQ